METTRHTPLDLITSRLAHHTSTRVHLIRFRVYSHFPVSKSPLRRPPPSIRPSPSPSPTTAPALQQHGSEESTPSLSGVGGSALLQSCASSMRWFPASSCACARWSVYGSTMCQLHENTRWFLRQLHEMWSAEVAQGGRDVEVADCRTTQAPRYVPTAKLSMCRVR